MVLAKSLLCPIFDGIVIEIQPTAFAALTVTMLSTPVTGKRPASSTRCDCVSDHYERNNSNIHSFQVDKNGEIIFYDSVTGKPLFVAPRGRSFEEFRKESVAHGWPSFRDEEVPTKRRTLLIFFTNHCNVLGSMG
jgi:hypothetical protein